MRFALIDHRLIPEPLVKEPHYHLQKISEFATIPPQPINPSFRFSSELQSFLSGRSLLADEIPFSIQTLHEHYLNGYVSYEKGVDEGRCLRCGNKKPHLFASFHCSRCHTECTYCRNCIMMGRVSECTPLIRWIGPEPDFPPGTFDWTGTLSEAQKSASEQMKSAIQALNDLLVWAVCGAGKTEVLFEGIDEALGQNKRVCIAAPRTDVILELSPRLKKVFPQTGVTTLYGGSEERHSYGQLVLSTTHQLYRFKEAFDVMIIDEVDAFPYSYDSSLQGAVEKARKPLSSIIYLTATPDQKTQQECARGKRNFIGIPARFHRHPIPLPRFVWCGLWKKSLKKNRIPPALKKWTSLRIQQSKQALIFFPTVALMEKALPLFQDMHPLIESVHAEDPDRKEKVLKMRQGEIPILLTTTILERGVTIPNIDVAVLGAEEKIFTESALVQIAGRVGRSTDYPTGDIVYFHYGRTGDMIKALLHIDQMNKEAAKRGLLHGH
ncbi:DEAD/DEAH box helicase [Rossellomorea vietnamensis]|uniref:DEAD/DEAH box helicase n=1 Tax=Rossellomorea vietnamensis TaxID=218284 RepID=UPI0021E28B5E|nr:DEAD/DEAH box helicase [Rossellomorea vietnamensis]